MGKKYNYSAKDDPKSLCKKKASAFWYHFASWAMEKRLCGDMSVWQNVRVAKRPCGETSEARRPVEKRAVAKRPRILYLNSTNYFRIISMLVFQ